MSNVYLDRDVPDESQHQPEDLSPVDVPRKFIAAIHKALEIARDACVHLSKASEPKQSAIEFWCDMVGVLENVERDITIVTDPELERKI